MAGTGMSRNSLLASFSTQRGDVVTATSSKTKVKQRAASAIIDISSYNRFNNEYDKPGAFRADDSIDKLASMLLDDTTRLPLKDISGSSSIRNARDHPSNIPSIYPFEPLEAQKNVSDSQDLSFTAGDDSIHFKGCPLSAGALAVDENTHALMSNDVDNYPPPILRQPSHARKGSGPPIPRKSSKRLSVQQAPFELSSQQYKSETHEDLETTGHQFLSKPIPNIPSTPIRKVTDVSTRNETQDVGKRLEKILAEPDSLKPGSASPRTPASANRSHTIFDSSKLLSKVRNAFSGLWSDKGKARKESIRLSNLKRPEIERDLVHALSSELRSIEDAHLNNAKTAAIGGHGEVRRLPLGDDEQSLRSRASAESLALRANTGVPWHFSHPGRVSPANRSRTDLRNVIINQTPIKLKDIQSGLNILTPRQSKEGTEGRIFDFDALLDTPPQGASTPRLRLEPSFERNGKKKLVNVAASSPSMFDPGRTSAVKDVDDADDEKDSPSQRRSTRRSLLNAIKRRNSQLKDAGIMMRRRISYSHAVTKKKHPSPSKEYLDELSQAFEAYARAHAPVETSRVDEENDLAGSLVGLGISTTLAPKDSNVLNQQTTTKLSPKGKEAAILNTPTKTTQISFTRITQPRPSKIPRPIGQSRMTPRELARFRLGENTLDSRLTQDPSSSIDELQWDASRYQIGMKKTRA